MYLQTPTWGNIKGLIFNYASGHFTITGRFVINGVMEEYSPAVRLCEEEAWLPPSDVTTVTCTQTALWGGGAS